MLNGAALASLTSLFRNGAAPSQADERLVDLFRNRVQLKKDLAALRNENYRLHDAIKRQVGSIARVEKRMASIEALLRDPDWSHNVVAFFQLRAAGDQCHERLRQHAEKLRRQREEAVQSTVLAAWRRRREDKAFAVKRKISECRTSLQDLEARLGACHKDLEEMGMMRRFFRRRMAESRIESMLDSIDEKRGHEDALLEELQRIDASLPPDADALDVRSKRMLNIQILGFAQLLFLHYDKPGLAQMIREAQVMQPGAISYGDKATCDAIVRRLREAEGANGSLDDAESTAAFAERTRLIADSAEFRRAEDVIPIPASVATVYDFDEDGSLLEHDVALLGDNYFGIGRVLVR